MILILILVSIVTISANPFHKYPYVFLLDVGNEELEKVNSEQIRLSAPGGSVAIRYPAIGDGDDIAHVRVSGIDFGTDLKATILDGGPGYKYVVIVLMGNQRAAYDAVITVQTVPDAVNEDGIQNIEESGGDSDTNDRTYQVPEDRNDSAEDLSESQENVDTNRQGVELTQESSHIYRYAQNEAISGYGQGDSDYDNDNENNNDNEKDNDDDDNDNDDRNLNDFPPRPSNKFTINGYGQAHSGYDNDNGKDNDHDDNDNDNDDDDDDSNLNNFPPRPSNKLTLSGYRQGHGDYDTSNDNGNNDDERNLNNEAYNERDDSAHYDSGNIESGGNEDDTINEDTAEKYISNDDFSEADESGIEDQNKYAKYQEVKSQSYAEEGFNQQNLDYVIEDPNEDDRPVDGYEDYDEEHSGKYIDTNNNNFIDTNGASAVEY